MKVAVDALSALAHGSRLALYRLLVQAGPHGASVGELQSATDIAAATLTHHLHALRRAGLIVDTREGRSIICHADNTQMSALLAFLTKNCSGDATACAAAVDCKPTKSGKSRTRS